MCNSRYILFPEKPLHTEVSPSYPVSFLPDSTSAYLSTEHRAYCSQKDEKPTVGAASPHRRYAGILSGFSYLPPEAAASPEQNRLFLFPPIADCPGWRSRKTHVPTQLNRKKLSRLYSFIESFCMNITIKRIYDPKEPGDGYRVLVDRLWPRGISKEKASWDEWLKNIAPSTALRQWFAHDPVRWDAFRKKYDEELDGNGEAVSHLLRLARKGKVTLLYSARNTEHNEAAALRDYLLQRFAS